MKLSRVATIFMGAALGTFAAVWWVRHHRTSAAQTEGDGESVTWIELK